MTVNFQTRVAPWMTDCFGDEIARDKPERNHRFAEEALELVQACDMTAEEAHLLVDYVFGRPAGEKRQEVGGVMVTLAALCLARGLDMHQCGETELARVWGKIDLIREKQKSKPALSPLPGVYPDREALHGPRGAFAVGQTVWVAFSSGMFSDKTMPLVQECTIEKTISKVVVSEYEHENLNEISYTVELANYVGDDPVYVDSHRVFATQALAIAASKAALEEEIAQIEQRAKMLMQCKENLTPKTNKDNHAPSCSM